ncbi:Ceramide synthase 4 [Bagarius yarrelli]|uniref:Ceramide synthase 4 n=1 Tax=Bagarius yarrelli TaxID=175774 RepID=A0A556TS98_BAGYA|nr:Ceramide synthase 4 [Bagarius yarrelli]
MEKLLNQWLWSEEFWLPPNITWHDIESTTGGSHQPLPRDLLLALPLALGFIAVRFGFERAVALPLSRKLGVFDRVQVRVPHNPKLEAFYLRRKKHCTQSELMGLEKHCGLTQRQIQNWLRRRRNQDKPSNTKKFCEASQPGFGTTTVAKSHYWYYILELSFYLSLLLCVSVDVKRKDFKEQILHHIATISLISFSYCNNYIRVGTVVMLLHDSSDFLLESAKMFNYAGWKKTCDSLFIVFAVVFLGTRLFVFPCRVLYSTFVESLDFFKPFPAYYLFNGLLLVLQALHMFWAYLILRMLYKFIFLGKVEKDERSDESDVEEEGEDYGMEEECCWEKSKDTLNSKLVSLADNCVLKNLTHQSRNMNSRLPKAR